MKQFLSLVILTQLTGVDCLAYDAVWQAQTGEVEFSITSDVSGATVVSPNILQSGYDGAWGFNQYPNHGLAQTFTVASSRVLKAATLRIGTVDPTTPSGQFEIAVFQFDTATQTPANKLGSVLANASDYLFGLQNVPRSTFDFSGFGIVLSPANTYAVALMPTATFTGRMSAQGAADIYPGGSTYYLNFTIPEPNSITLTLICSAIAIPTRRRKSLPHNRV